MDGSRSSSQDLMHKVGADGSQMTRGKGGGGGESGYIGDFATKGRSSEHQKIVIVLSLSHVQLFATA